MNDFQSVPPAVVSRPVRRNTSKLLGIGCGGCGILFLLALIGAVHLFQSGSQAVEGADKQADVFLKTLEKPDYQGAYKLLSPQTQATTKPENIQDVMEAVQKRRGAATSHEKLPGFNINTYNGVTQVRLAYQEHFRNGNTSVQLLLTSEQGNWKVTAFDFQF